MQHQAIPVKNNYEDFTYNLEETLGLLTPGFLNDLTDDPASMVGLIENLGGDNQLILFNIIEHGELLRIKGKPTKAKQYQIGNPMIAIQMTQRDIRAGLYAPLRILVYENASGVVMVEYDLPSSIFGTLNDETITTIALSLDKKVADLIKKADA